MSYPYENRYAAGLCAIRSCPNPIFPIDGELYRHCEYHRAKSAAKQKEARRIKKMNRELFGITSKREAPK